MPKADFIKAGKRTVAMERDAVTAMESRIADEFVQACELIMACKGRVVVTGMGKSGHIGRKIAATLASTGTPSFFLHPSEAGHGDSGMITKADLVLAISNSGCAVEILTLLPVLKRLGVPLISMTGKPRSVLAQAANVVLDISVVTEACPLDLAPTSSTTVTLVMGDALAVALLEARGFTAEDFAFSHPGGLLGRRLLLLVEDVMHKDQDVPRVGPAICLLEALAEMSSKGFGMTTVVDENHRLLGIFTDGDLRRAIDAKVDISRTEIGKVMSRSPQTVSKTTLAAEALTLMEQKKITALVVADENATPIGVIHMHDLLRAGLI